ncbi:MAG: hypothetical protein ABIJ56_20135 [Pseudomonadota bacterium]
MYIQSLNTGEPKNAVLIIINKILYAVFTILVALSALKDRNDRVLAWLVGWVFLSASLLTASKWLPRDPAGSDAWNVLVYWIGDALIFSWYAAHAFAWDRYRGNKRAWHCAIAIAVGSAVLLAGSILYRKAQFDAGGVFLGLLEKHVRWTILHALNILAVCGAVYHLVRYILKQKVGTAHLVLMFSTFGCLVQIAFTMKLGIIIDLDLYSYGLLVYLIAGVCIYGYRFFWQRVLRPGDAVRPDGDPADMEAGPPAGR